MLGQQKPAQADPDGTFYTFERGVKKTGGGEGWPDVWMKDHFAWEYKRKRRNLVEAYYQPGQLLELVEIAVHHPASTPDSSRFDPFGHEHVLRKLPEVIRRIAYSFRHLPRCCDLLWELGRDDDRKLNPYPDHAMRVLTDLASYDPDKPLAYNRVVLEAVTRWLEAPRQGISGQPFPQDIALRDRADEMTSKLTPGTAVHRLFESLRKHAEAEIKDQIARDEELDD